jgi:DNA-binding response OmpR family regulator
MARILVIDDSRDTLEMLRVILHERGHHDVTLSTNGKEGLEKAVSEHPDLAIIDVMMPEMTGYEVVGRIRANARIADLPIIILTARGQPVDKIAAMEAGADLHMSKPVDVETLLEQVDVLLGANKKQEGAALFPILSLRGGVGTTTIAVNLALLMQQIKPTVLVDLSPNSGHCAAHMDSKSVRTGDSSKAVRLLQSCFRSTPPGSSCCRHSCPRARRGPIPSGEQGASGQAAPNYPIHCRRYAPTLTQTAQLFLEEASALSWSAATICPASRPRARPPSC